MPKSPTAVEVPVKDLFSSSYLFNIPGYQRPYSWTETQTEELFEDLWDFLQLNPESRSNDAVNVSAIRKFMSKAQLSRDFFDRRATSVFLSSS